MLVFWKEKLVFLAVPKTGTTAVEGALAPRASIVVRDPPDLKHAPVYRYKRFLEPYFTQAGGVEDMESFAVVRHPVDWLGSWFRYRSREDLIGHPNSTRGKTFDAFVIEYTKGKPASWADVGSQAKFLLTNEQAVGVTHLFRYEAQPVMINFLEKRLDMTVAMNRVNISPEIQLTLSNKAFDRLKERRAAEFDVWEAGLSD